MNCAWLGLYIKTLCRALHLSLNTQPWELQSTYEMIYLSLEDYKIEHREW